ncbi:MAG: hypothetical protein Q4C45_10425 [Oscillospiraceae bacterium]|nr:hypothetical protein [Oscillospiraceae bacterium]
MKERFYQIGEVPALLLGEQSDRGYLFVRGKHGRKEEARLFFPIRGLGIAQRQAP